MAGSSQAHSDQFVAECIVKSIHIILHARAYPAASPANVPSKPNRWFLTEVPELPEVRSFLEPVKGDLNTPVEVEVHLGAAGRQQHVLLERWRLHLDPTGSSGRQQHSGYTPGASHIRLAASNSSSSGGSAGATRLAGDDGALYKRLTLLVRCLACQLRVLPVHRLVRAVRRQPIPASRIAVRICRGSAHLWVGTLAPAATTGSQSDAAPAHAAAAAHELQGGWAARPATVVGGEFRMGVEHIPPQTVTTLEETVAGCPSLPTPVPVIITNYMDSTGPSPSTSTPTPSGRSLPSSGGGGGGAWSRQQAAPPQQPQPSQPQPGTSWGVSISNLRFGLQRTSSARSRGPSGGGSVTDAHLGAAAGSQGAGFSSSGVAAASPGTHQMASSLPKSGSLFNRPPVAPGTSPQVTRTRWGRQPSAGSPMERLASTSIPGIAASTPSAGSHSSSTGAVQPQRSPSVMQPAAQPGTGTSGADKHVSAFLRAGDSTRQAVLSSTLPGARLTQQPLVSAAGTEPQQTGTSVPPSSPMQIPGSTSQRTRSMADMQVVYNFPDNLPPVGGAAGTGRSGARHPDQVGEGVGGGSVYQPHHHHGSALSTSGLLHHGHGSAPAAPRGMLGQALEAHWAKQAQKAGSAAAGTAGHAVHASLMSGSDTQVLTQQANSLVAGSHTAAGAGDGRGDAQGSTFAPQVQPTHSAGPGSAGTGAAHSGPGTGSVQSSSARSGGAAGQLAAHHQPTVSQLQEENSGRCVSWRVGHTPNSPSLPFAFTPSAQSLNTASYGHFQASRYALTGTSAGASPSAWSGVRTPGAMHHASGGPGTAHGSSWRMDASGSVRDPTVRSVTSSSVISGRDVSVLALARRPSWMEHSARVGRGSGTSGSASPAVLALSTAAHSLPSHSPAPKPTAATATPPRYGWPTAAGQKADLTGQAQAPLPAQTPAAATPVEGLITPGTALPHNSGTAPSQLAAGMSYLWDVNLSHLPPVQLVTVLDNPLPEAGVMNAEPLHWIGEEQVGAGQGQQGMQPQGEEDDLPFLIELGSGQPRPPGGWVAALLPKPAQLPVAAQQQQGRRGVEPGQSSTPQGIAAPARLGSSAPVAGTEREVAVGLLLAHLASPLAQQSVAAEQGADSTVRRLEPQLLASEQQAPVAAEYAHRRNTSGGVAGPGGVLTCAAALEQLDQLNSRLASLLTSSG